ncbi:MAG: ABC transporter family substrate-binding protein [Propionibacteriaceae bacterium]|nr:ABC transporter family substrate-binding protein [Propionibacteriaceae bacterium]
MDRKKKDGMKLRRLVALPVIAMLVVTGCSGPTDTGETNTEPLALSAVNATDPTTHAPGGELRLAVDEIGSFNPMSEQSSAELARLQQAFLPTFFRYDERGVATPNPDFLVSATETSTNPTKVTLALNPKAVWGDGKQITAADMIATWTACNGRSTGFRCAADLRFRDIQAVTQGANESTVELTFNRAYPQWRGIFDRVSVLRAESVSTAEIFNTRWTSVPKQWTSGPFTTVSANSKAFVASPNKDWWGTPSTLGRFTIKAVPRENQVKAFLDAQIDAVDIAGSKDFYDAVRARKGIEVRTAGSPMTRQLVFNTSSVGPVGDPVVRQAIANALDRSGIGTKALPGVGFTAAPLGNRIYLPGQEGYADNIATQEFARDQAKARKLLDSAGWRGSDEDGRSQDGRRLEVRLARIQGLAMSENEAQAITDQLRQVGVTVITEDVTLADFDNGSVLAGGDFDMIVVGIQGGHEPLATLDARFGAGAEQNWARFENPEVDARIKRIETEADPAQRAVLANELDQLLSTHMPTVPLYQLPQQVAVGVQLTDYGAPGLSSTAWERVGYARGE